MTAESRLQTLLNADMNQVNSGMLNILPKGTFAVLASASGIGKSTLLKRLRDLPNRTCIAVTHRTAAMEISDWQLEVRDRKIHAVWHGER